MKNSSSFTFTKTMMSGTAVIMMLTLSSVIHGVNGAPLNDLIVELPGYGRPPTSHFSGYLDASKGCDLEQNGPVCKIHYWLALADVDTETQSDDGDESSAGEKKNDASSKPTVLWLNGGPGSSSLLGWLQEVGPLLINATGGLMKNPYSWTNAGVNLLAIEAPMGVGFSYCSKQVQAGHNERNACHNSDTSTARASRAALVDFFQNKFPELQQGPFYIAGESYAGVYIPTLSKELLTDPIASKVVPLQGIMVGDPCTDNKVQSESMGPMWYANKYGLMDSDIYNLLQSDECSYLIDENSAKMNMVLMKKFRMNTNFTLSSKSHHSVGKKWSNHVIASELNEELQAIDNLTERRVLAEQLYSERVLGIKNHDIIDNNNDHEHDTASTTTNKKNDETSSLSTSTSNRRTALRTSSTSVDIDNDGDGVLTRPRPQPRKVDKCTLAYRKFLLSSSDSLSQGWHDLYIDDYSLFAPVTSKEDEQMAAYFNRKDVRAALNVIEAPIKTWPRDADIGFWYEKEYDACNWQSESDIKFSNTSMIDIYQEIVPHLQKTWVYNGDTDPCVSYEGTREAVKQILIDEVDGGSYRPWFYNQTAASLQTLKEKSILFGPNLVAQSLEKAQFGGEVVDYEQGLKFVTFHGSGHMVPQFRPQAALHFLRKFVHGNTNENEEGDYFLSPLMKSNDTLTKMTDEEFEKYMDKWTESAMAKPYV